MADDIMTRLREINRDAILMWDEKETIDQAAFEIERLRTKVELFGAICEVLIEAPVGSSVWNNARQTWAVRGG